MTAAAIEEVGLGQIDERYRALRLERPELVTAVRHSIERDGLLYPLVANRDRSGAVVLLDGFKRLRVLRELEHEQAPVRIVSLSEADARAALMAYNAPHRGLLEIEEAWVIHSLVRGCKLPQAEVATLLGRHKSWVCRRLALAERLESSVQQDMRLGLVPATVAREVVRLPRGNQGRVTEVVREHKLTSRQCAALVDASLSCDEAKSLGALLDDPLRYLGIDGEKPRRPTRDPRLSAGGEAVRQRLVRLDRALYGVGQIFRERPPSALEAEDLAILGELCAPLRDRGLAMLTKLEELCQAAGGVDEARAPTAGL